MLRNMLKVIIANWVFGSVHSALASRKAKQAAASTFGERNRNGLYRLFYLAQSVLSFGILAEYIRHQPSRELYRAKGPLRLLMHAAQGASLVYAVLAARQVGIRRMVGEQSFSQWRSNGPVAPEPEAQGPALDEQGKRRPAGPFAWSRHPLNFAPLPVFWLWPRMSTNLLTFNIAATLYLIIGSLHEEARLEETAGDDYREYQHSGVPFYLPKVNVSKIVAQRHLNGR